MRLKTALRPEQVGAKPEEATYAEYLRQKASASGGRAFRLALW